jgi:hypothetical protein
MVIAAVSWQGHCKTVLATVCTSEVGLPDSRRAPRRKPLPAISPARRDPIENLRRHADETELSPRDAEPRWNPTIPRALGQYL